MSDVEAFRGRGSDCSAFGVGADYLDEKHQEDLCLHPQFRGELLQQQEDYAC